MAKKPKEARYPPSLEALILKHGGWNKIPEAEWARYVDEFAAWMRDNREAWNHGN